MPMNPYHEPKTPKYCNWQNYSLTINPYGACSCKACNERLTKAIDQLELQFANTTNVTVATLMSASDYQQATQALYDSDKLTQEEKYRIWQDTQDDGA